MSRNPLGPAVVFGLTQTDKVFAHFPQGPAVARPEEIVAFIVGSACLASVVLTVVTVGIVSVCKWWLSWRKGGG